MLKVLHFLDSINRGGAEVLALDICRNARKHGLDLTFVTAQGGSVEEEFKNSGAEFIRLRRRAPLDFNLVLSLRKLIRQREIRIVHGSQAVEGLHLYLATVGLPVKRVLSFHGLVTGKKNLLALRFLIPQMHANLAVSRALQDRLQREENLDVRKNFQVLYNGIDAARLEPSGKSVKAELGLSENTRLIGMIGNFYGAVSKDQMTICRALPRVFAEFADVHCIFAGLVESKEKFQACVDFCRENKIAERVHFLGARTDVPDILAEMDLFVFSSLKEGQPLAALEAMLARVPLIVSDIEPLLEICAGGKYAEVFRAQDESDLSDKILKLLADNHLRLNMAKRAYEFARENFSIEAHLENLKKLYRSII